MLSTVMRRPLTTGLPLHTSGLIVILLIWLVMLHLSELFPPPGLVVARASVISLSSLPALASRSTLRQTGARPTPRTTRGTWPVPLPIVARQPLRYLQSRSSV